jgi:CheY-like chemotaxis protein
MKQPFVLVIDDDVDVAYTLRYLLQREGFEVGVAHRSERGVEMAFDMLPDLIISDVTMAGFSGIEVLRILKGNPATAHIPIILTSGREQLACAGMFTFLMKPFDGKTLVTAARNALAGKRDERLATA